MKHGNLSPLLPLMLALVLACVQTSMAGTGAGKIPITTSSDKARQLFIEGRDLVDKLRFQEAREYFEKAVTLDPEFAWAHLNLAFTQPSASAFFESLDRAVALADKASDGERLLIMASQAGSGAETAKQEKYLKKLVTAYPNDARAHNLLATFYMGLQDYPAAIEEYNMAVKIEPDFSPPYNQLGYIHRFLGDYEQAEKAFRKYIDLIPDDPNPYDSYAELLMEMGKFKQSIELYRKALKVNSNFAPSYVGMATDYNLLGEHQMAREELEKLYNTALNDGQKRASLFSQAVSYADEGNLAAAMICLKKQYAIAEKIDDASAMAGDLNAMGTILLEMKQYDDALKNFDKALQLVDGSELAEEVKDNFRRAHIYNSARVDLLGGRIEKARAKAQKHLALTTTLNNPFQIRLSHELAGMVALAEMDYVAAVKELKQTNQRDPYNHYRLALAYRGAGKMEQCKKACATAAGYNALNNLNYALIRGKAVKMMEAM